MRRRLRGTQRSAYSAAMLALGLALSLRAAESAPDAGGYLLSEPGLRAVVIAHDDRESFLGLQLDSAGRLFAGGREALFVFDPAPGGLYQPKQELCRFPADAWIYDIAIRGDDLYVATHTAIYVIEGGVKRRTGLVPRRLVWGLPMMQGYDMHQGMHGLAFGPEGDLHFANGDEIITYGNFARPDHWSHWTYFHGTTSTPVTGCGGVFRVSPDGARLAVTAAGLRNSCGIAFDRAWNLFTSDNDHESLPALYVPGRLLHVTPGAYFAWPRGWMPEKGPWRADLLDTLHPSLGRYVPTGMAYYDDDFLPAACRHRLYVAEWGAGKLLRYPLRAHGASFKAEQADFLRGPPNERPVGVAVGRGGRLFTSVCHMKGNEASPIYRSEIVMITRADDPPHAPFDGYEETEATTERLYAELDHPAWHRRYRAHVELLRRGAAGTASAPARLARSRPDAPAHGHLIWLAAAAGATGPVADLLDSPAAETRHQALRALVHFAAPLEPARLAAALEDANPQVVHAALVALREAAAPPALLPHVIKWARGDERLLRQAAVQALAVHLPLADLRALCASADAPTRRAGLLVAGQRLTVPPLTGPLPADWPLDPMTNRIPYGDATLTITAGNFTVADVWPRRTKSPEDDALFDLLARGLHDAVTDHAKQAAFFLRLLNDPRVDAQASAVLGLPGAAAAGGTPLAGATSTGITELPEAFCGFDWTREAAAGSVSNGALFFATRGCAICHSARPGDTGGGGPSLAGSGSRFSIPYLVEAVLTPNKTVSPIFKWTLVTRKDGTSIAGLVTSETGSALELLLPAGVRQTIPKGDIARRELQDRSPMPEGLVQTPADLRDLLAFLAALKDGT
jgi:putative heme-binding domain-containing protein